MRDHIICVDDEETALVSLRQQLGGSLADRCVIDLARTAPAALQRIDELQRAGEPVAVILASQGLGRGLAPATASSPPVLPFLIEAHRLAPHAGKVLLIDRDRGTDPGPEFLRAATVQAGLSGYLHRPLEETQLRLTVDGLLATFRLARKNEALLFTLQEQQRELATLNQNLEARIRERTLALEEANRRLSQLAVTDGLTGLFNHRYLQEHLVLEVERSLRTGVPLGMLMIDVDHFRHYNNRFGHQTGDEVLRRVARLIGEHRRVNDVVARYGGEEFALLLINADHRVAANIAERLRARVCAEPFPQTHELPGGQLTISIGVASCPADGTTGASLVQSADAALFRAKNAGRNLVCVSGQPDSLFAGSVGAASGPGPGPGGGSLTPVSGVPILGGPTPGNPTGQNGGNGSGSAPPVTMNASASQSQSQSQSAATGTARFLSALAQPAEPYITELFTGAASAYGAPAGPQAKSGAGPGLNGLLACPPPGDLKR